MFPTAKALARTYSHPSYDDPWEAVLDYRHVMDASAKHPQKGSGALSSIVELPRGRIRAWVDDGGMPDAERGIQSAIDNGWLPDSWDDDKARSLNLLAAWILSSGSINETWVPYFVVDSETEEEALQAIGQPLDIRFDFLRSTDAKRATEFRPIHDASVLGRVLYTWIGIRGDKSADRVQFPQYILDAPEDVRREFAQIYVQHRHTDRTNDPTRQDFIQIAETRTNSYRRDLAHLLESVVTVPDSVRATSWPLRLYEPALRELRQWPDRIEPEARP